MAAFPEELGGSLSQRRLPATPAQPLRRSQPAKLVHKNRKTGKSSTSGLSSGRKKLGLMGDEGADSNLLRYSLLPPE